jgi:protein-tyrosine-phosphatase
MKNIVFICVENANRSQMAQAFAKMQDPTINSYSAGSKPSGKINPRAIRAMNKIGYDLNQHDSSSTEELPNVEFDYLVTMGCGDTCPYVPAKNRIDWNIPDPREMDEKEFEEVRDLIRDKVSHLLNEIKKHE